MRHAVLLALGLACGCTPLRPLDPGDDARTTDARATDAARTPDDTGAHLDAWIDPVVDAAGPDAVSTDAAMDSGATDAPTVDTGEVARADGGRDAWSPDAWAPDAWVWGRDAWVARDAPLSSSDLVAWYPFDGIRDATGHGHDLTNLGASFVGAIASLGAGDRLSVPSDPELATIVGVTMWVRPVDIGGSRRAVFIDREGHLEVLQRLSGSLRCSWAGSAGASGTQDVTAGVWTHVACVFDAGQVILYVGGVVDGMTTIAPTTPPAVGEVLLGQACCTGADELTGDLNDVRLWRRVPSALEIAALAADPP